MGLGSSKYGDNEDLKYKRDKYDRSDMKIQPSYRNKYRPKTLERQKEVDELKAHLREKLKKADEAAAKKAEEEAAKKAAKKAEEEARQQQVYVLILLCCIQECLKATK